MNIRESGENKCGECNLCCELAYVPPLSKPSGVMCGHCAPSIGCRIYATRPPECSAFSCLWLSSQTTTAPMSADLRPDRCGVMFTTNGEPNVLEFHVHRMTDTAWRVIEAAIRRGDTARLATAYLGEDANARPRANV